MKRQLAFEPEPTPEQVRFLEERLCESNATATGIHDGRTLAFFLRGDDGEILAGLCGHTWGGSVKFGNSGSTSRFAVTASAGL